MRKILVLFLTLILAFTAAACGDGGENPIGGGDSTAKKGSVTIKVPMTQEEKTILQAAVDGYRAINPLVSITIDETGAGGDYPNWLNQAMQGDVSQVAADIVRNNLSTHLFGSGKFVDIAQYLSEENPYADGTVWRDTLDPVALVPDGAKGEIYMLSFQSTQVSFYYNKDILTDAGVDASKILTWNDLVAACEKIKAHDANITPLSVSGSSDSFWSGQMSWIFRAYIDQHFRDAAAGVHTQAGDWNYDRIKDAAWQYGPLISDHAGLSEAEAKQKAYFNDDPRVYTQNELRLLGKIMDGEYGPDTARYKNMLANLMEVFPKYCGASFSAANDTSFWEKKAAITIDTTDLLVDWQKRTEISPESMFALGRFDFPAMTAHAAYPSGVPAVDYTRSIGGPHGYYGIINKSAAQTALVIDFMKFWVSKQGQELEIQKRKEMGIGIKGVPYVKDVEIPAEINILSTMPLELKGIADFNPAATFARGLGNEPLTTRDFTNYADRLFKGTDSIDVYASKLQTSFKNNMGAFLSSRGYRTNALNNVSLSPF
jgi:ABC-type glycerol-3-phosphate transport system substrate-binding protein